ncbi:hypothetical protein BYT27DRAFT_7257562 [Phlegmacium glaucopus]|nr:hypothetical protein BYT27DRAFT_7257562 [Phlegmacium glaucopus]
MQSSPSSFSTQRIPVNRPIHSAIGAGKSNLMDAIFFVFRSKERVTANCSTAELGILRRKTTSGEWNRLDWMGQLWWKEKWKTVSWGEGTAKKALEGLEVLTKSSRYQSTAGVSEYKLNDKTVHIRGLQCSPGLSPNILVKVKIFLVPQELASEYEAAREAQERATENATFNFTKRRGIAGEIKQYNREQKSEADRFDVLCQEQKDKDLGGLRQEQSIHEIALESALTDQAKARITRRRRTSRTGSFNNNVEVMRRTSESMESTSYNSSDEIIHVHTPPSVHSHSPAPDSVEIPRRMSAEVSSLANNGHSYPPIPAHAEATRRMRGADGMKDMWKRVVGKIRDWLLKVFSRRG